MLIDLHVHTSGISKCCLIDAAEGVKRAKAYGIDGVVITNHYQKSYIGDDGAEAFAEKYIEEYFYAEVCGAREGVKVFRGIELSAALYPHVHILIYGTPDDFIRKNPTMYEYTQEKLYEKVKENGGIMVQAHPFRNGTTVLNTDYLDGIEINCHPLYKNSYSSEILNIAREKHLIVTCGGDYHADTYRPKCGLYLPDSTENMGDLTAYLTGAKEIDLCVHEPNAETAQNIAYIRR